jgi:hypothetical protein
MLFRYLCHCIFFHHITPLNVNRSKMYTLCLLFVYLLNIQFALHNRLTASLLQSPPFQCCLGRPSLFVVRAVVPSKPTSSFFLGSFSLSQFLDFVLELLLSVCAILILLEKTTFEKIHDQEFDYRLRSLLGNFCIAASFCIRDRDCKS